MALARLAPTNNNSASTPVPHVDSAETMRALLRYPPDGAACSAVPISETRA